ncbi:unnamed protein product, partial [Didymodactylos carnosus]
MLKNQQPLKFFNASIYETETHSLTQLFPPKLLINRFQLEKSQLAFTLCTKNDNGTMRPYWNSIVFSNVMTEGIPHSDQKMADNQNEIQCPSCFQNFNTSLTADYSSPPTTPATKRKREDSVNYNS